MSSLSSKHFEGFQGFELTLKREDFRVRLFACGGGVAQGVALGMVSDAKMAHLSSDSDDDDEMGEEELTGLAAKSTFHFTRISIPRCRIRSRDSIG